MLRADGDHARDDTAGTERGPSRSVPVDAGVAASGQPAVTGVGFSIGTPIRLPYSVQLPS
jgi:hypothetical protein